MPQPHHRSRSPLILAGACILVAACAGPEDLPTETRSEEPVVRSTPGRTAEASGRRATYSGANEGTRRRRPRTPTINQRLQRSLADVWFSGDLDEVARAIQRRTEIPIITTPEARALGVRVDVEVRSHTTVRSVLKRVAHSSPSLAWRIRNGVVMFYVESDGARLERRVYDVRDLVTSITTFVPPKIDTLPRGDDGYSTTHTGFDADRRPLVEPGLVLDAVRGVAPSSYWEQPGVELAYNKGLLIVVAHARIHARIGTQLRRR